MVTGGTLAENLLRAISEIRAGTVDLGSVRSLAMSKNSLVAATAALKRAKLTGRLGKGGKGMLKRAAQRSAGVLAMRAATSAAITGALDGVHGSDPRVVTFLTRRLEDIFSNHGAVHFKSPLLRPKHSHSATTGITGGPAEVLSKRGLVLVLPEDLTAGFGKK